MPRGPGPSPKCTCGTCRACRHREAVRRWSAANPERAAEIRQKTYEKNRERRAEDARRWKAANPEKAREANRRHRMKKRYGLEWQEYLDLVAIRGEVCWICGSSDPGRNGSIKMCVDHDHSSGAVRGLLCGPCNNGIARFRDDPSLLRRAADYVGGDLT